MDCEKSLRWLTRLNVHYQPVRGFESKIKPERVEGFGRILETITDHTGRVENMTILDIGSNLGWFCFQLTDKGAQTYGIELNPNRTNACKCVAARDNYNYDNPMFINDDVVQWVLDRDYEYDYILLLNAFHHILLANESGGWEMFNKLINSSKGIFVMMRNSLRDWKLCDSAKDIGDSVLRVSDATHYTAYAPVHGRVIYVFSKG